MNVFFGGTFDPPHLGHHEMLLALLRDPWAHKVFLVPTSQNPLKKISADEEGIFHNPALREEWMQLWLGEVKRSVAFHEFQKISLELSELQSVGPAYTIDTLQKIKAREEATGNVEPWVLVKGGDDLADLPRWKEIETLLGLLHSLWIFARGKQKDALGEIPEALRPLCDFRLMMDQVREISSTEIRSWVLQNRKVSAKPGDTGLAGDAGLTRIERETLAPIAQSLAQLVRSGS